MTAAAPRDGKPPLLGFIDPKIGLGSILVLIVNLSVGVGWVLTNIGLVHDIRAQLGDIQRQFATFTITLPIQNEHIEEARRRISDLEARANTLEGRLGAVEQKATALQVDVEGIHRASNVPLRTPR